MFPQIALFTIYVSTHSTPILLIRFYFYLLILFTILLILIFILIV